MWVGLMGVDRGYEVGLGRHRKAVSFLEELPNFVTTNDFPLNFLNFTGIVPPHLHPFARIRSWAFKSFHNSTPSFRSRILTYCTVVVDQFFSLRPILP
jgi:hypothetical protein